MFEAGLVLNRVKYHGKLWVLIPLNVGLLLLVTTWPRLKTLHVAERKLNAARVLKKRK